MLILSRKVGEAIVLDGRLFVRVVELLPDSVRLSISGKATYGGVDKLIDVEIGQGDMIDVDTYIYYMERDRNRVKLGFDAPENVIVLREELLD